MLPALLSFAFLVSGGFRWRTLTGQITEMTKATQALQHAITDTNEALKNLKEDLQQALTTKATNEGLLNTKQDLQQAITATNAALKRTNQELQQALKNTKQELQQEVNRAVLMTQVCLVGWYQQTWNGSFLVASKPNFATKQYIILNTR